MDLIRLYSEIAFGRIAKRFLSHRIEEPELLSNNEFIIPDKLFLDEARVCCPELSDDNLKMIYRLGVDDWSFFNMPESNSNQQCIFNVLAQMSSELLICKQGWPMVKFNHLFRWREITQVLGEDLLTCTFLAFADKYHNDTPKHNFDWPSVIHNDNPHLHYLFETKKLCDLHSHLKASTCFFEISWVALMNNLSSGITKLKDVQKSHESYIKQEDENFLIYQMVQAAFLRWHLYQLVNQGSEKDFENNYAKLESNRLPLLSDISKITNEAEKLDAHTSTDRDNKDGCIYDYIPAHPDSPMGIYAGERWLLYKVLHLIFKENNPSLIKVFYKYVLSKSLLRTYFIQINQNIGFANFNRYQGIKSYLLDSKYSELLTTLPVWEARTHNYSKIMEVRSVPSDKFNHVCNLVSNIEKYFTRVDDNPTDTPPNVTDDKRFLLIFHFIKQSIEQINSHQQRSHKLRTSLKKKSIKMQKWLDELETAGIDAASTELECRPEIFGQAFRFLKSNGYHATFHVGEDFYDIADGLRAIDEAILFLDLTSSDRLGHALALGINSIDYYKVRHNVIALPKQWMLDNVVWLTIKSKELGVTVDSQVEWFLHKTYNELIAQLGYSSQLDNNLSKGSKKLFSPDIYDYWQSMMLRGDNPSCYSDNPSSTLTEAFDSSSWDYYNMLQNESLSNIRKYNKIAVSLYLQYHCWDNVKKNGKLIKQFSLPEGYASFIEEMQNAMIKYICKKQICIECCPSSNVKIGKLERFDSHPIFRFMPLDKTKTRYPLSVTVNTDDLGVFATSLPNEFSLLALALLKMKDCDGNHLYSPTEVYDWIARVIENGHKFTFLK